jgi:flagellar FliJ protein
VSRFTLAGLLRARTVQETQARRELGAAQATVAASQAEVQLRELTLSNAGPAPSGPAEVFLAGAAARAAMAAAVGDALVAQAVTQDALGAARSAWLEARLRARAIERLAERDREARVAEAGRAEQLVSDDLAGARHRHQQGMEP